MGVVSPSVSPHPPRDAGTSEPCSRESSCSVVLMVWLSVARYDLQIRYLPEDFMERFQEDRTTLLYFYQQVRGDPGDLPAPASSTLQPP